MFVFLRLLSLCPLWLLHALGSAGGWLVWALDATYRQRFVSHAAQAGYDLAVVRGAVGAAGRLAAELPRLWLGKPVHVEFLGTEYIDAAHAAGKGVIFLTPHLGCFEITPQAYAARYASAGRSITVLYRPPRKAWLAPLFARARQRPGMAGAPASLAGIKQMLKALSEVVGELPPISYGPARPGDIRHSRADNTRLLQRFTLDETTPMNIGLTHLLGRKQPE